MSASKVRRGFTFIELIVVIAIIVILAALLIPAIGMLHRSSFRAKTTHNIGQLTFAVSTYLDTYGRLGSLTDVTETDAQHSLAYRSEPTYVLDITPMLTKAEPFFSPSGLKLVTAAGAGVCAPAVSPMHATHLCDAWGTAPDNVLSWAIINGSPLGKLRHVHLHPVHRPAQLGRHPERHHRRYRLPLLLPDPALGHGQDHRPVEQRHRLQRAAAGRQR